MVTLFSYVVARDYGFAPNPFYGVCTLATCKPEIRRRAQISDWIVGTGSRSYDLEGRLVFFMQVADVLSFDQYWDDPRFFRKRPELHGSIKQAFGDNIYHRNKNTGRWVQEDSHHSLSNGRINTANVKHDTQVDRVLIGIDFAYWGEAGPKVPKRFRRDSADLCKSGPGHKCHFRERFVDRFLEWVQSVSDRGFLGKPSEFR